MDIVETQRRLSQSLANDTTIRIEAEKISLAKMITAAALEVSDHGPSETLVKTVGVVAQRDRSVLSKNMLMFLADAVAINMNAIFKHIRPDELLRTKLALVSAFDLAFQQPKPPSSTSEPCRPNASSSADGMQGSSAQGPR